MKFPFGDVEATCASNAAGDQFYVYFTAFESTQILEGYVGTDGIVTVTYDKSGFMAGDAQKIIDLADKSAWKAIKR